MNYPTIDQIAYEIHLTHKNRSELDNWLLAEKIHAEGIYTAKRSWHFKVANVKGSEVFFETEHYISLHQLYDVHVNDIVSIYFTNCKSLFGRYFRKKVEHTYFFDRRYLKYHLYRSKNHFYQICISANIYDLSGKEYYEKIKKYNKEELYAHVQKTLPNFANITYWENFQKKDFTLI